VDGSWKPISFSGMIGEDIVTNAAWCDTLDDIIVWRTEYDATDNCVMTPYSFVDGAVTPAGPARIVSMLDSSHAVCSPLGALVTLSDVCGWACRDGVGGGVMDAPPELEEVSHSAGFRWASEHGSAWLAEGSLWYYGYDGTLKAYVPSAFPLDWCPAKVALGKDHVLFYWPEKGFSMYCLTPMENTW
jgi:hypothetical protein